MRAMEICGKQLALTHLPIPTLAPDEVLIRTAYIGLNRADLLQRDGLYPPPKDASPLPGLEISGTIAALGSAALGWTIGEEVCALLSGGGYAEYVTVPAAQVIALPHRLSLREGACLPEAAATAVMALGLEASLVTGERVLIHGGTSGLGLIMGQVAKSWGAQVIATVGSAEKVAFLRGFGIDAINHHEKPFAEQVMTLTAREGVDVIIDTLGGPAAADHLALLRRGGRMVTLAVMQGTTAESLKISRLLTHRLRWSGTTLRSRDTLEKAQIIDHVRHYVWPHVTAGAIRPVIDSVFPLEDAEKALSRMQERLHLGKILLEVASK